MYNPLFVTSKSLILEVISINMVEILVLGDPNITLEKVFDKYEELTWKSLRSNSSINCLFIEFL